MGRGGSDKDMGREQSGGGDRDKGVAGRVESDMMHDWGFTPRTQFHASIPKGRGLSG